MGKQVYSKSRLNTESKTIACKKRKEEGIKIRCVAASDCEAAVVGLKEKRGGGKKTLIRRKDAFSAVEGQSSRNRVRKGTV